jgi:hypothetical protein
MKLWIGVTLLAVCCCSAFADNIDVSVTYRPITTDPPPNTPISSQKAFSFFLSDTSFCTPGVGGSFLCDFTNTSAFTWPDLTVTLTPHSKILNCLIGPAKGPGGAMGTFTNCDKSSSLAGDKLQFDAGQIVPGSATDAFELEFDGFTNPTHTHVVLMPTFGNQVPEPATVTLVGVGLAAYGRRRLRRMLTSVYVRK